MEGKGKAKRKNKRANVMHALHGASKPQSFQIHLGFWQTLSFDSNEFKKFRDTKISSKCNKIVRNVVTSRVIFRSILSIIFIKNCNFSF